jgi:tRNA(Ile)-lysidine synthetase-like protein
VRHELIPYLAREFSPGIAAVLAREAAIARDDEDFLEQEAIDLAASNVLTITNTEAAVPGTEGSAGLEASADTEGSAGLEASADTDGSAGLQASRDSAGRERRPALIEIDARALTSLHPALASRVARHALSLLAPQRFIGFDQVERLLQFAQGDDLALSLPGQQAVRRGNTVVLGPAPSRHPRDRAANAFRVPLSIPGEVRLDRQGWTISAERAASLAWPAGPGGARAPSVAVAAAPLELPLAIRSRRPGDRFRPLGLGHGKKLQDFLVDRKIPRDTRDSLPLVVDSHDRIVWVVGEAVAEDFRVTEPAREVILLKARRLGGLG